jgi:hypothetical protein
LQQFLLPQLDLPQKTPIRHNIAPGSNYRAERRGLASPAVRPSCAYTIQICASPAEALARLLQIMMTCCDD